MGGPGVALDDMGVLRERIGRREMGKVGPHIVLPREIYPGLR